MKLMILFSLIVTVVMTSSEPSNLQKRKVPPLPEACIHQGNSFQHGDLVVTPFVEPPTLGVCYVSLCVDGHLLTVREGCFDVKVQCRSQDQRIPIFYQGKNHYECICHVEHPKGKEPKAMYNHCKL